MVRLRYLEHNLEVPEGEFIIGRSTRCQLSIDDALVSRQHASMIVTGNTATIEDLGSRNGVIVNGKRIPARYALADGDTITIGSQSMTIHGLSNARAAEPESDPAAGTSTVRRPELQTIQGFFEIDEPTSEPTGSYPALGRGSPDRRVNELSLIGSVAEKALALGRFEDAQRLLEKPLRDVLARVIAKDEVDPAVIARASHLGMRLAVATSRGEWVDYLLELYTRRVELLPQPIVDELYTLLRKVRIDSGKLRSYLNALRTADAGYGPNERFQFSRIEGLETLVGLK